MLIKKYKKLSNDKYKIYLDNKEIILYEDIIIKHKLLIKKEIDEELLNELLSDNNKQKYYNDCVKYITTKMRSKKEVEDYFKKREVEEPDIQDYLQKLEKTGLINDLIYAKAYINDKLNLSNSGPYKIKQELLKNNIDEEIIDDLLSNYNDFIKEKLTKIISKKINQNKKYSFFLLKKKILNDLINSGYNSELIIEGLNNVDDNRDEEILLKEYEKIRLKLSKKYNGKKLDYYVKQKLYQLGFPLDLINKKY